MRFTEIGLRGAYIIEIEKLSDERGFFGREWCQREFEAHGLNAKVVQANVSRNYKKGTLRGMHYQLHPYEETKLVRCTRGSIYDVIIDLRPESPTFKESFGVVLDSENYKMLYVPEGFAHGYITLTEDTEVSYKVTQFYSPGYERGLKWNDPAFNISWPIAPEVISDKDKHHPDFDPELLKELILVKQ